MSLPAMKKLLSRAAQSGGNWFQYIEIINTGTAANPNPAARNLNGLKVGRP